jgi:predicted nucleotidyltransferase
MRLTSAEIEAIRAAVRGMFGPRARVRVFGSRADDAARGGDLDLFVEVDPGQATFAAEAALLDRLGPALDDLRVDLVLHERGKPPSPIAEIAHRDGIEL